MQAIREYRGVDIPTFHDTIVPSARPAVLRHLIDEWPSVQCGARAIDELVTYLKSLDVGAETQLLVVPPSARGRLFYNDAMTGLAFERQTMPFAAALERIVTASTQENAPALAIQSAAIATHLPGFSTAQRPRILSATVPPHIWIGTVVTTATHADQAENLACVVAGRRRFTLFPPEQLPNLYMGPFEVTPAGTPVSMVSLHEPDLARYPRFATALAAAEHAELGLGDALYIPYHWWHHVESLEPFNVLVNYWWNSARPGVGKPFDALLHAIMSVRELPPAQRDVWRAMYDYYVFERGVDPGAHLPPHARGILGKLTDAQRQQLKTLLEQALARLR